MMDYDYGSVKFINTLYKDPNIPQKRTTWNPADIDSIIAIILPSRVRYPRYRARTVPAVLLAARAAPSRTRQK